jgi:cobalt-zinc-cadmium resistance protein CzcA
MNQKLEKYPGVTFNFSQNIQDNVEEAMSGVKGENSLKLFGDDINVLTTQAEQIRKIMSQVPGITDLGVFKVNGQPNLLISINREAAARSGISAADLNAAVQAAIGGITATQVLDGDRRFDFVVRYEPQFRQSPEAIRNILLPTSSGFVPLGQVASVTLRNGAFGVSRKRSALSSDQVQYPRTGPRHNHEGRTEPSGARTAPSRRLHLRVGG